jgi:hypothetical protein
MHRLCPLLISISCSCAANNYCHSLLNTYQLKNGCVNDYLMTSWTNFANLATENFGRPSCGAYSGSLPKCQYLVRHSQRSSSKKRIHRVSCDAAGLCCFICFGLQRSCSFDSLKRRSGCQAKAIRAYQRLSSTGLRSGARCLLCCGLAAACERLADSTLFGLRSCYEGSRG